MQGHAAEQILMRTGTAQQDADSAFVADDDRVDF